MCTDVAAAPGRSSLTARPHREEAIAPALRWNLCQALPFVNVALILANFAVWIVYEIPHLNAAVFHASFYPCTVNPGASGAIAAVLGAYFILYPRSKVLSLVVVFPVWISAWVFLGLWFVYQLVEANFGLFSARAGGGGTAFFAHVGGFVFGLVCARVLVRSEGSVPASNAVPA